MARRWCAVGMLEADHQLRRVKGHLRLPKPAPTLKAHLKNVGAPSQDENQERHDDRAQGPRAYRGAPVGTTPQLAAKAERRREVVLLRYNYRLYPTAGQQVALTRAFGCARVVFNDGLRAREHAHQAGLPYLTDADLSRRLTLAKRSPNERG